MRKTISLILLVASVATGQITGLREKHFTVAASYRVHLTVHTTMQPKGEEWYWIALEPTTKHGICAHMSHGSSTNKWYVERPWGVNKKTHMSLHTDVLQFDTRDEAETFVEARCPSDRIWIESLLDDSGEHRS